MKEISIKPSVIPNSGLGLFAEQDIKAGEAIVKISGPRYNEEQALELEINGYLLDAADGSNESIDVEGPARYANDAFGITRVPGMFNNSAFLLYEDGTMWLTATRNIKAGNEIFVSYGRTYWARMKRSWKEEKALAV